MLHCNVTIASRDSLDSGHEIARTLETSEADDRRGQRTHSIQPRHMPAPPRAPGCSTGSTRRRCAAPRASAAAARRPGRSAATRHGPLPAASQPEGTNSDGRKSTISGLHAIQRCNRPQTTLTLLKQRLTNSYLTGPSPRGRQSAVHLAGLGAEPRQALPPSRAAGPRPACPARAPALPAQEIGLWRVAC